MVSNWGNKEPAQHFQLTACLKGKKHTNISCGVSFALWVHCWRSLISPNMSWNPHTVNKPNLYIQPLKWEIGLPNRAAHTFETLKLTNHWIFIWFLIKLKPLLPAGELRSLLGKLKPSAVQWCSSSLRYQGLFISHHSANNLNLNRYWGTLQRAELEQFTVSKQRMFWFCNITSEYETSLNKRQTAADIFSPQQSGYYEHTLLSTLDEFMAAEELHPRCRTLPSHLNTTHSKWVWDEFCWKSLW